VQRALPSRQNIAAPIRVGAKGQGDDKPVGNRHGNHGRSIGMSRSAADVVHDRIDVAARERQDQPVEDRLIELAHPLKQRRAASVVVDRHSVSPVLSEQPCGRTGGGLYRLGIV